ncbi:MAG TPA: hypothetical protein VIC57_16765 [Candidatus Dormibacteraeota bacterium]|jgi:hypothetical protein
MGLPVRREWGVETPPPGPETWWPWPAPAVEPRPEVQPEPAPEPAPVERPA